MRTVPLLTASEVARKCDRPHNAVTRAELAGLLTPDLRAGKVILFRKERLPELRALLCNAKGAGR